MFQYRRCNCYHLVIANVLYTVSGNGNVLGKVTNVLDIKVYGTFRPKIRYQWQERTSQRV